MWILALLIAALGLYVSFSLGYLQAQHRGLAERVEDMEDFVGKHYHLLLDRVEAMEGVIDKPAELDETLRRVRIDKGKESWT